MNLVEARFCGASWAMSSLTTWHRSKEFELHRFLAQEVTDWERREYFELL